MVIATATKATTAITTTRPITTTNISTTGWVSSKRAQLESTSDSGRRSTNISQEYKSLIYRFSYLFIGTSSSRVQFTRLTLA